MLNQKGLTTLEAIITLAICVPSMLCLGTLINQSAKNLITAKNLKNKIYNSIRIKQQFQMIMDDLDRHTFYLLPKVHKSGNIRHSDGSANKIISNSSSSKPSKQSDAISYLELDIKATQKVMAINSDAAGNIIYSCSRFSTTFTPQEYVNYLLLTPKGFYEASAKIIQNNIQGNAICVSMQIQPTESLIGSSIATFNSEIVSQVIPIKSIYTLYVDSKETLRYLGHKGVFNIENQPVVNKVGSLKIDSQYFENNRFFKFLVAIKAPKSDKEFKINLTNSISRKSFLNFMLNRI